MDSILKKYYAIDACSLNALEGYESVNFKVTSNSGTFVLKKYPYSEETLAILQAEDTVAGKLQEIPGLQFSKSINSLENSTYTIVDGFIYRLLPFIEGEFLAEIDKDEALQRSFGTAMGTIDKTLLGHYDAVISAKETLWDLKHFTNNRQYLDDIPDTKDRNIVRYFFIQFHEQITPVQHRFRKSTIHNDANDWNILTTNGKVTGVIDFGDMCHTWLINELAIGLTYVMMGEKNPLMVAKTVVSAYNSVLPLEELELDALYYLIAARLCTSVCNSAHTKKQKPDSDYITISEQPAWNLLRKWLSINPILVKDTFRKACGFNETEKQTLEHQLNRRTKNISNALSLSYTEPIQMSRSAFQFMYDTDGNTILDAYNNIMQVGHCHPRVVEAGQRTMARLNTNTRYVYEELLSYSEKLLSKFPSQLNKVFFVNSGSAASDLAMRMAKTHTNKKKVMVLEHGYHGNTQNGIDISHYKYNHKGGKGKMEHILQTPMPKVYGCGFESESEASAHYSDITKKQIADEEGNIAAFIAEPIVGCGGQVPLAQNYLKEVYPKIRAQGGICISDEVQVGFGRLGSHFWGYEMYNVVPDMVILGKPMGNGHPIGAVVTTSEIAESFDNGMEFFSSFGGNPVSCGIGEAVLDVIEEDRLQAHAFEVGSYLKDELSALKERYKAIGDVRGSGLFLGVEIIRPNGSPDTALAQTIKNSLRENYILISTDGPYDNVLKIKPPLYFNLTNSAELINQLKIILDKTIKIDNFKQNKKK
ncbi:aminotransferase class III-fold pyridoxal phosphate-dependent enzyme [Maribacter chungangensis]|uniref:Aminotransferase class III-fold pyridoxal phosphate-dependent enzyme n=1 Tax=Maribacter chungangensis TaxID=1069117 RepID=A0ABW3B209_9FLAO